MLDNFKVCENTELCLSWLHQNQKLAVALSREQSRMIQSRGDFGISCFEKSETIYEYSVKFMVREEFPYLNELNNFIRMASSAGLIEKWRSNIRIKAHSKYSKRIHHKLRAESFYGIIMLVCGEYVLVVIIFFLEIIIHKKVKALNSYRFWNYAEMFVNPERYFCLKKYY